MLDSQGEKTAQALWRSCSQAGHSLLKLTGRVPTPKAPTGVADLDLGCDDQNSMLEHTGCGLSVVHLWVGSPSCQLVTL